MQKYAKLGLRTLVLAKKEISEESYDNYESAYKKACLMVNNRQIAIEKIMDEQLIKKRKLF